MKNVLKLAWAAICSLFTNKPAPIDTASVPAGITETDIDHAITIVNSIRNAMASPAAVLITDLIPGSVDNVIRQKLVDELPVLVAGLTYSKDILTDADPTAAVNAILEKVKFSDNPVQDALWHNLAAQLLMIISDGKVNWSLAVQAVEYYFKNLFKPA